MTRCVRRKFGYKPVKRKRFTLDLWDQWRAARRPDETSIELRAGIQEMRSLLARRSLSR
jgi:hypothetical protein